MSDSTQLELAAEKIVKAGSLVVLTGAGVSKESGIPTFRDALEGLWADYDPEELATPKGFAKNPPLVWKWYDSRRKKLAEVEPNPGHYAIRELEDLLDATPVITQNIDGLHHRAGSSDVVELHGSIAKFICAENRHPADDVPFDLDEPPNCKDCGSMLRPAVVWFGESLPPEAINRGFAECEKAKVILIVGTSGIVYPAASLPFAGRAFLIEVNPEESALSQRCDMFLKGPGGKVLPQLVEAVKSLV